MHMQTVSMLHWLDATRLPGKVMLAAHLYRRTIIWTSQQWHTQEALPSEPGHHANGYGESGSDSDDTASPLKAAKRARARSGASAAARALIQQMKAQHKVQLG